MAVDIGPKIGIQGESEFRKQIQQTNQALKTLEAEQKAVASSFHDEADAEKKAEAQKDNLNRQISTQLDKLELLEKGLQESARMYGEADTRTMKWQQAVHEATAKLNDMERELGEVDGAVDETTDSMEEAGEATSGWADVMKGQLLADAVKAGLSMVVDLAKSAASAMWEASKAGAAYADEILTLSSTSGLDTETLQQYRYMADLVDVSVDTLTGALTKLTSKMSSANKGNEAATEAFKKLGVSIYDSSGKLRDSEDVFNDAIEALGKVENETERDTMAMDIFGKSAKELNPLIEAGADRLNELAKEAKDTGYVLSGDALTALGKQQDAMDRLDKRVEGLSNRFAAGLAPSMENAYSKLEEFAANPKVQLAMEDIAKAISAVIDAAVWLAEKALPIVLDFFGIFDDKIRIYTEDQLTLMNATDELVQAHADLAEEYSGKAQAILDETQRTQDLWDELQELADSQGRVRDSDKERAKYILNELNEALGTQLTMEGRIIQGYKDQQEEIDKLIEKRRAEALLAAKEEGAAALNEETQKALDNVIAYYDQLDAAWAAYHAAVDANNEAATNLFKSSEKAREEMEDALAAAQGLQAEYEEAQAVYRDCLRQQDILERARVAAANENYAEVTRLLTDEMGVTVEYYARKEELNEADKKRLEETISHAKDQMIEYEKALTDGAEGASEAGLKKMQDYVDDLQAVLEGRKKDLKTVGQETGGAYLDGLYQGMRNSKKLQDLEYASAVAAGIITDTTKERLTVHSPSRYAAWLGQMWDEGLIKGLADRETELAKAAESLADTIAEGSDPGSAAYGYGNALTAAGTGYGAVSNAYTTNLGGITVRLDAAGEVNEDVLAQRIAVRLTDELRRAQRGGRM